MILSKYVCVVGEVLVVVFVEMMMMFLYVDGLTFGTFET